ncbi:hypothetical protein A3I18_00610 [Candidatus Campbellbacteria bacterium RIFCSPLOWO2_02_FULL_35_11]|uniref:Response regulatory domain-containing protein n=1 Tax=Candidatus Campbellbacteria bacterium RIFCSPLOWO2_02_FULL_35_11 TaxID=1797581 RepID=A0A1F5ETA2_9BACT|nr:MAG: hypothetical protein A3I18_00610 [Candidatus Campbellbacteria bacterium RIFCSPLOWO2_02_FULL_35_11]
MLNEKPHHYVLLVDASEEIIKMVKTQIGFIAEDIKVLGETDLENARYIFDSCHKTLKAVFVGSGIANFSVGYADKPITLGFIREIRASGWNKPLVGFSNNPDFVNQMKMAGCNHTFCQKGYLAEEILDAVKNHDIIDVVVEEKMSA